MVTILKTAGPWVPPAVQMSAYAKKTGRVALYESTSHYDPETKQSRPIRKYLGTEDPETGELVPSSGKRGRKKGPGDNAGHGKKGGTETDYIKFAGNGQSFFCCCI